MASHKTTDPLLNALSAWLRTPCTYDEMPDSLRAVLAEHGLAVVPREPTEAMLRAAGKVDDAMYASGSQHGADDEQIWRAMVEAAHADEA